MRKDVKDKVSFKMIRYANCWEDACILLKGLSPSPGSKILSIGSAGDNSFSLLTTQPELVIAVDINPLQLYLIELKKICFNTLSYDEMLGFLGFTSSSDRVITYKKIRNHLSTEAKGFWDSNFPMINGGVIHFGKFEKYFQFFSKKVLPWIHSEEIVTELFRPKTAIDQEHFYRNVWNSLRWKMFFKIFFSRFVLGKYGRDPQFLNEVQINVARYIFKKAAKELQSLSAQNNFILHYSLTGTHGSLLPHYVRRENFEIIKSNLNSLTIEFGSVEEVCFKYGKINAMNLSNIFEYMDHETFKKTSQILIESLAPGGKLAYWNLMVPRMISDVFPQKMQHNQKSSASLSEIDKGFFYNQFIIDTFI